MLNLKPLVARLVEDVLQAIRQATLAELHELTAASNRASPRKPSAARRVPIPSGQVKRPSRGRVAAELRSGDVSNPADGASVGAIREPTTGADITDPERLLAASSTPGQVASEEQPPPLSVRPKVSSVVTLRPGERLASASGAGIVIRRHKKM
jgi:hypothetical protein